MKIFALVSDGVVIEVIRPASDGSGRYIEIGDRYPEKLVSQMIDVTSIMPEPKQGFVAASDTGEWIFSEVEAPALSAHEILALNEQTRSNLLSMAALEVAPLQDAIDLGSATEVEEVCLAQWKHYRVSVNRVDLSQWPASWPARP